MAFLKHTIFLMFSISELSFAKADNTTTSTPQTSLSQPFPMMSGQFQSILPMVLSHLDMKTALPLLKTMTSQIPTMMAQNLEERKNLSEKTFQCLSDINTYVSDLLAGEMWALSMFDATGKLCSPILQGCLTFMGNFDQCLESVSPVYQDTGRRIQGDTCVVTFPPPQAVKSLMGTRKAGPLHLPLVFNWHMCVPSSCDNASLLIGLENTFSMLNATISKIVCHNDIKMGPVSQDPAAIGTIVLVSVLGFLVLVGSGLDLYVRAVKKCQRDFSERKTNSPITSLTEHCDINQTNVAASAETNGNSGEQDLECTRVETGKTLKNKSAVEDDNTNPEGFEIEKMNEDNSVLDGLNAGVLKVNGSTTLNEEETANGRSNTNGVGFQEHQSSTFADTESQSIAKPQDGRGQKAKAKENPFTHLQPYQQALFWQRFLLCFSAVTNGEKILSVKSTPGSLTCLNGIRVLSMGWVILGHTLRNYLSVSVNPLAYQQLLQSFTFQIMVNALYSVDSFFVLSGFLVTYLFLRETKKRGRVQPKQMVMYYLHRYLRLTPAYAFMILVSTFLIGYFTDGPTGEPTFAGLSLKRECLENWWTNLLYVNNIVNSRKECLVWGWYLANDMQFYIVAPLALLPFAFGSRPGGRKVLKILGVVACFVFIVVHISSTMYFVHKFNTNLLSGNSDLYDMMYLKPWCRIGPFAFGMLGAFLLHMTGGKIHMSPFRLALGWLVAIATLLTLLLVTYDEFKPHPNKWSVGTMMVHESLSRPAWGLLITWIIVMCCTGKGGIINSMLSWDWWQPLSRLTYGAYLIHLVIIILDTSSVRTLVEYSVPYLVQRFLGCMTMSFIFSFLLAVLVEAPFLQLEKLILG